MILHQAMVRVMAKRDARSLDHATLEGRRRLAGKGVLEGGETQVAVARSLEVHPVTVAKGVGTYRRRGDGGLARRIAPGPRPTLTPKQQAQLRRWIIDRTPQQFRFPFALWTLPLIAQLIEQRFGVVLHKTTVARLLARLGDRKSTRLNSSHVRISYAVFCLKKKKANRPERKGTWADSNRRSGVT